jgi:hypothetical protein
MSLLYFFNLHTANIVYTDVFSGTIAYKYIIRVKLMHRPGSKQCSISLSIKLRLLIARNVLVYAGIP